MFVGLKSGIYEVRFSSQKTINIVIKATLVLLFVRVYLVRSTNWKEKMGTLGKRRKK